MWPEWNHTSHRGSEGQGGRVADTTGISPLDREVVSVEEVSILDDAREGMNPDIRPQDDLFGHVNGAWLETAEIPERPVVAGARS